MLQDKIEELNEILESVNTEKVQEIALEIFQVVLQDGIIYLCGNGGSGATANMFDEIILSMNYELAEKGIKYRVRSYSLNISTVHLAETIHHQEYHMIFGNQLNFKGSEQDLLIAISGSGNSQNVVEAIKAADTFDMETIGLTGMGGGIISKMVQNGLIVNSNNMLQIENVHSILLHMILDEVKTRLIMFSQEQGGL